MYTNEQYTSKNCATCGTKLQEVRSGKRALNLEDIKGRKVLPEDQREELRNQIQEDNKAVYNRGRACRCPICHASLPDFPALPDESLLGVNRDENAAVNILISFCTLITTGKLRYEWRHPEQRRGNGGHRCRSATEPGGTTTGNQEPRR